MKVFTEPEVLQMRDEMQKALDKIAKKYNAKGTVSKIKYSESVSISVEIARVQKTTAGEFILDKKAQAYLDRAPSHQLPKEALGRPFKYQGRNVIITGYNTRAPRYPMNYTMDGTSYKSGINHVEKMLQKGLPELFL